MFVDSFLRCIWIHTDTLFTNFDRCDPKSAKASRKLRERSAKALTSWDGPPPFDRGVAVPTEIWRLWCLAVPTEIRGRSWGPAVPTEIWRSRLRSGSAHWDLELAFERGVEDEDVKEEEATRRNINPHVATVITAAKRCPLCLELKVSTRTSLRKTGNLCHMFSAKARESEFQTHGCRERKTLHRERFTKEMAKGKIE